MTFSEAIVKLEVGDRMYEVSSFPSGVYLAYHRYPSGDMILMAHNDYTPPVLPSLPKSDIQENITWRIVKGDPKDDRTTN